LRRAKQALEAGCGGVVAAGRGARAIRAASGSNFLIVTPGIRLPGGDAGDQSRVTTPQDALRAGANHIVVGRPITAAPDPRAAAETFIAHIESA
jgi:orotidine-5'-phosphate decarboxylase